MGRRLLLFIAALILVAASLTGSYVYDAYLRAPESETPRAFVVAPGESAGRIAWRLSEEGFLDSPRFFSLYARLAGVEDAFQAGTFELASGMSFREIVRELRRAEAGEVQVTIPEGFTLAQIGERVREVLPHVTAEAWDAAVGPDSPFASHPFVVAAGKPSNVDLEGYLFPDTYRFFADATAEQVARRMLDTMAERFGPASADATYSGHEILTLASIVEREVRGARDMALVSDIFRSRLDIGMPLQADSTISYYLGKTSAELTVDDLRADEPFNTYTRLGLPPGPIANPGLDAIRAALHPEPNAWLFFLTADDGTVAYASTFEEHVANKNRYLR